MDAQDSLSELLRLSTQVVEAVIAGATGLEAASVGDERAAALARAGTELLEAAADVRPGIEVERVAVDLPVGAVIALRGAGRTLVARTVPEPALALVTYDLRAALARIADPAPRARRKRGDA